VDIQESRRLQYNSRTDDASGAHEKYAQTSDNPIEYVQMGCPLPRAIENQQLMFDEDRLGNYRTDPARPRKSSNGSDEMDEKDDEIGHLRILAKSENATNGGHI